MPGPDDRRWSSHPWLARLLRVFVFALPIAGSVVFVHLASRVVAVPTGSFVLFAGWWVAMSGSATVVLIVIDKLARRLLPLVALYRVSLLFPDAAPSRLRAALLADTTETLEDRVRRARLGAEDETPVEAATHLLRLVADLDRHDRLTRGHSERVRAYSRLIGTELGLTEDELDLLNWSALLHDVGKLEVPEQILALPDRPTDEQWEILRRHPEYGAALVEPLQPWLGSWVRAVAEHHEHWDGTGYPRGLAGEQVALAARIVAVADAFDVITSARSYKSAADTAAARAEIARCAGTHFDPRVVRALLGVSLGRLRIVMGPLSWLAHAPILGRLPLTPAVGGIAASLGSVAAALTTGLAAPAPAPGSVGGDPPTAPATRITTVDRTMQEDGSLLVRIDRRLTGRRTVRIVSAPAVGHAQTTEQGLIRYTPPPDFTGTVAIGYRSCASAGRCVDGRITIVVEPVNDPPVARPDAAATTQRRPVTIDVLANDTDPEGDTLSLVSATGGDVGRARIVDGRLVWTPRAGFLGIARFEYTIADGNGGAASATVAVRVGRTGSVPVPPAAPSPPASPTAPESPADGRPPTAVTDEVTVVENGTVLVDVLANDTDPDGDRLTLVSVGSPGRGSARTSGDRVQYVAPTDYVGPVRFAYTIADPSGARATGQVVVTVRLVNDPPTFAAAPDQSAREDAGPQIVAGWTGRIDPGGASEAGQAVVFEASTPDGALFAAPPRVDRSGTLRYTPAADAFGTARVTVVARDDGGTANGGRDASTPRSFAIAILPVNDAPSFTGGPDQTIPEGAPGRTVAGWASALRAGPANEGDQTIIFLVDVDRPGLFAAGGGPRVTGDGALVYAPAADANGTATVTVRARDDGGTANGGDDTSPPQTFTITVGPVNDAPSFTPGSSPTVPEDAGPQTIPGWATSIRPGPSDEAGQTVDFVVSNDSPTLFSAQPAISPGGTLTFTPAPDASGTATITVRARDDGGTADGGSDTSAPRTFTITVTPVEDPPIAADDAATATEDDPSGVTFDVLANDTDADPGDTLSVTSYDASSLTGGTLVANGGGSFTYVPDSGFSGTETFTYVVGDGNGGSDTGTVTISVTPVPNPPVAGDDAYSTPEDTTLTVSAPGLLGNDGDPDGDPISIQTALVSSPSDGTATVASDGSFAYTPNAGFVGTDSFVYRIDDGTGRTADGTVTIVVTSSPPAASRLYFSSSGPSADVWDLTLALPPAAPALTDFDGDTFPGLTIKAGDGKESISDGAKYQTWTYVTGSPLSLNGPVELDIWTTASPFGTLKRATLYAYLYDCLPGGVSCTKIASNTLFANPWNTSLVSWGNRVLTIGSVTRVIPAGNELRVKVLIRSSDLWVTMTAAYPSALVVTTG